MSRWWQFSQLSDAYSNHNLLDAIPQAAPTGKLFIGGLKAVTRPDVLEQHAITHVLSVVEDDPCAHEEYSKYQRLWIPAEDHPSQNLLQHVERTNAFIERALTAHGVVIVHCAMGVSRSASVVCAYLMKRYNKTFLEALGQVQEARPLSAPNVGFVEQLQVYERMLNASSGEDVQSIYTEWLSSRGEEPKL